jgi:NRPS condensation-like uncharacterized protein
MTDIIEERKPFQRDVTRQEQRFLMAPNSHISLGLKVSGKISEKALRNAVDKMLITYPLFGVRIRWDDETIQFTTESATEIPVKVYKREGDRSWLEALNKEHSIPLKPSKGPLTRIILVKGSNTSELFIFCHHLICDGRSLELALREILLHLADPNRTPPSMPDMPPHTPEIFPENVSKSKVKSWFIKQLNKKWQKEKIAFDEEDLLNIWESFWKNSNYGVELFTLDKQETQRFVDTCRANEVTVNSALVILFIKARSESLGSYKGKATIGTAVDTRNRLQIDVGRAVGLYAGGVKFGFNYKQNHPFWENAREYHKMLNKHLKDNNVFGPIYDQFAIDPTLFDALLFAILGKQVEPHQSRYQKLSEFATHQKGLLAKYLNKADSNIPDALITNLGRLDLPAEIGGLTIEGALFTPSSGLKLEITLGAATAGGRLTATLNYHDGYFNGANIQKIRDKAKEILKTILQPTSTD